MTRRSSKQRSKGIEMLPPAPSFQRPQTDFAATPLSLSSLVNFIAVWPTAQAAYSYSPASRQEKALEHAGRLLDGFEFVFVKPVIEALIVALTAPLWLPICAAIAFLIWLEDGKSPIFTQKRIGKNGKSFTMLKFRTMVPDAEKVLREKILSDNSLRTGWNDNYKLRHDPRITRIGGLLRRCSFDELPQLLNIVCGDMSLVGPRPLPDYHHINLSQATRSMREMVRPGLTGLWQVSGRSDIGNRGMELWDPFYVRNWSLWLDIDIIIRTINAIMNGRGAY